MIYVNFDWNKDIAENKNIIKHIESVQDEQNTDGCFDEYIFSFVLDKILEEKYPNLSENYWWDDPIYFVNDNELKSAFEDLCEKFKNKIDINQLTVELKKQRNNLQNLKKKRKN